MKCLPDCPTCKGMHLSLCTKCKSPLFLSSTGVGCVAKDKCEIYHYAEEKTRTCEKCDKSCSACTDGTPDNCNICNDGFYLNKAKEKGCYATCPAG